MVRSAHLVGLDQPGPVDQTARPTRPRSPPSAHAHARALAPPARSPANPGRSQPSRSPPPVPNAPPGAPIPTGLSDLIPSRIPGRSRSFSPPQVAGRCGRCPRLGRDPTLPRLTSPALGASPCSAGVARCGGMLHHRAAMPRMPRHHTVVITATVCGSRHQFMVVGDQLVHTATLLPYSLLSLHLSLTPVLTEWMNFLWCSNFLRWNRT